MDVMINSKILLAIPARGGSKRLLRKNELYLAGKPMLAYTIEAAIKSGLSEHVYVCTEDEEIKKMALTYGAKVFDITEDMAGDEISSTTPCLELYKKMKSEGIQIEYIFNLQPTSPLRNSDDILNAFNKFIHHNSDFLVSTTFIDPHYFHWGLQEKEDGNWGMYFGNKYLMERTLLQPIYRPNGAIKLGKAELLLETGNFFGESLQVYEMPEERSIHVATLFDKLCCEVLLEKNNN